MNNRVSPLLHASCMSLTSLVCASLEPFFEAVRSWDSLMGSPRNITQMPPNDQCQVSQRTNHMVLHCMLSNLQSLRDLLLRITIDFLQHNHLALLQGKAMHRLDHHTQLVVCLDQTGRIDSGRTEFFVAFECGDQFLAKGVDMTGEIDCAIASEFDQPCLGKDNDSGAVAREKRYTHILQHLYSEPPTLYPLSRNAPENGLHLETEFDQLLSTEPLRLSIHDERTSPSGCKIGIFQ